MSTEIALVRPINGRTHVRVGMPEDPRALKNRPGHVSKAVFVAAKLAGLSLLEARHLDEIDVRAIFDAYHSEVDHFELARGFPSSAGLRA